MRKVKKAVKMGQRVLGALVVTALSAGVPQFTSIAAPDISYGDEANVKVEVLEASLMEMPELNTEISPYTMLTSCVIGVSGASDGMHIDISTASVGTASVLGVKDVKIKKKTWYGGWDTVATSSGGEVYGCSIMGIVILYENAVKDATYKITCIHYGDVDGYTEGENDSGAFVFTY